MNKSLSERIRAIAEFNPTEAQTEGIASLRCGTLSPLGFAYKQGAEWENDRLTPLITALAESCEALENALEHYSKLQDWPLLPVNAREALSAHKKRMEGLK